MRRLTVLTVAMLSTLAACVPCAPSDPIDQRYAPSSASVTNQHFLAPCFGGAKRTQTFTAGRSGQLDQISVIAQTVNGGPLFINVRTTVGGVPADVQATVEYNGPSSPDEQTFIDIPIDPPVPVVAGHQYSFTADAGSCNAWNLFYDELGTYPGGQTFDGGYFAGVNDFTPIGGDVYFTTRVV